VEIYVPSDSEEEFDPIELIKIAKQPPSNFIWPPPLDEPKVPIAAPIYVAPPETQHITAKPCTYVRPLVPKPPRLSVQNVQAVESQDDTNSITENECLNVESNITVTTSTTSNASSESEYKVYQTLNNFDANSIENSREDDEEVEEINQTTDLPISLPENQTKTVEFVEPDPDYQAETFKGVFSNRKETWMKLTSSTEVKKVETMTEQQQYAERDVNPENSDEEPRETSSQEEQLEEKHNDDFTENQNREIECEEEDEEEDEIRPEIEGKHVGPQDGTYYQLPPSNIPQPIPRGYQSDFQKALITTSDKPYNIHDVAPTPDPKVPYTDLFQEAIRNLPNENEEEKKQPPEVPKFYIRTTKEKCQFPYGEDEIRRGESMFSTMMRTASPKPMEFLKSNVIEEVPLPETSDPYFPPAISMKPHEKYGNIEDYRSKSPFVKALMTIPDRPFTPFGREIKSQSAMEMAQNINNITFSNALNTAPDESFDPSSLEFDEYVEYEAKTYERIAAEAEPRDGEPVSPFVFYEEPHVSSFMPKLQPWSKPSDNQNYADSVVDTISGNESLECQVSQSRRCSEMQTCERRASQQCNNESSCERRDSEPRTKRLADLLNPPRKESIEEVCEPEKPTNAIHPRRQQAPSPFEGMQIKLTNKMTSSLHKADEIPTYQRKWFNLPTQNPPKTPEPEELKENIPVAFKDWNLSRNTSRRSSFSGAVETKPELKRDDPARASVPQAFPTKPPIPTPELFPTSNRSDFRRESTVDGESEDEFDEMNFPNTRDCPSPGLFPTQGKRKNSVLELEKIQKLQFAKQKSLKSELERQQQKMLMKQKMRQQSELEKMKSNYAKMSAENSSTETPSTPATPQQTMSNYEREQEFKRQLELEREQRIREQEIREQRAREQEYQRQQEAARQHDIKMREKRERDLQIETMREMEYQKQRSAQEEIQRRQQETRDAEMRKQQEEMEREIQRQQEKEKKDAEAREAKRLYEERMKAERDRELAKIEKELREKREKELKQLEEEIREKREQRKREEKEAEIRRRQEQRRLEEEAAREMRDREKRLQDELKLRQKQEADRKQREEMELFNLEKERIRQEKAPKYTAEIFQQQMVWPPTEASTPAPQPQPQQQQTPLPVPIIRTDSETELNSARFHFEPLDEDQKRFMAGIRPPSTCYSPPTDERPFPSIPYYQQHLAFYEAEAEHSGIFDPKRNSPVPNRSRSPAFGPPPNPLMAFVNKQRDPVLDESGIYLCGERLLSPVWYDKQNKSYPPGVQRKIHAGGSTASRPPSKPDLSALNEAIKKHKLEKASKAAPTPPPMPSKPLVQPRIKIEEKDEPTGIPKGIVAKQVRRLSGDASSLSSMLPLRSSFANENSHQTESQSQFQSSYNNVDNQRRETRHESNFEIISFHIPPLPALLISTHQI
jgi:hypothetical protein